ncbi:MAG: hypothetical protein JSU70_04440, partial [Phycisphaerales bacterium]
MKTPGRRIGLVLFLSCAIASIASANAATVRDYDASELLPRQRDKDRSEEKLGRGMVVMVTGPGTVYLGWRLLKTDPEDIAFNVYRRAAGAEPVRLNDRPITRSTNFIDIKAALDRENSWWVSPVLDGREQKACMPVRLPAHPPERQYVPIRLQGTLSVGKVGIADLDGDGVYDYVVKRPRGRVDPGTRRRS